MYHLVSMAEMVTEKISDLVSIERTVLNTEATTPYVSFTMPAYNEEDNIERTVRECQDGFNKASIAGVPSKSESNGGKWGEIVVTNDCSKDRTGEILRALQHEMPNLVVVTHHGKNQGYGRALSDAIQASRGQYIATIDSDGQFDPNDLPNLLDSLDSGSDPDCVAGFRKKKKDSFIRVFADRGLNFIVRTLFGIKHRDTNCAFKLIRGDILRNLNIETNGFQTPTEIILKLNAMGKSMVECGVTHRDREEGTSKLRVVKTSVDFLRFLFYLRTKIGLYRKGILAKL